MYRHAFRIHDADVVVITILQVQRIERRHGHACSMICTEKHTSFWFVLKEAVLQEASRPEVCKDQAIAEHLEHTSGVSLRNGTIANYRKHYPSEAVQYILFKRGKREERQAATRARAKHKTRLSYSF